FRIDYYHKISTLEMRCKGWFMLPAQNLRNLRCQPAQYLALSIDNIPFRVQFSGFGAVCLLHCSNSKRNRVATWHSFQMPSANFKFLRISHSHQAQPVCRDHLANMRLIRALHNSSKFGKTDAFLPYQQQCTDDSAHHPCKKGVRSKITIDKCLC